MAKTKISEFSSTPANNTDIDSINLAEGCAPSGINDAIRELMAQLKDFQTGAVGDSFNGPVGTTTAAAGAFTTLSSTGNTTLGDASGDAITINGTATFANANPILTAGTANGVAYLNGSKVVTSGSALVFDGTNLGVGVSPATKLDVNGVGTFRTGFQITNGGSGLSFSASKLMAQMENTTTARMYLCGSDASTGGVLEIYSAKSNGSPVLGLVQDGSANLGLGVTPSAGGATANYRLFEIGLDGGGSIYSGTNQTLIGTNIAWSGGTANYKRTGSAPTLYNQQNGAHSWSYASTGTAGNAITFTQAMTLDASGNLGVGATSPTNKVDILTADNTGLTVRSTNYSGSFGPSGLGGMALTTAGAYPLIFYINSAERARIDSSGNLLVGCTALGATGGFGVGPNSGSSFIDICHVTGTASGTAYARFFFNSSQIGSITQSGTTAVLYNLTSDQRLKENIQDAESSSNLIDSIQVRKFDWKTDQTHQRYGFIAQELVTVYPEAVHQPQDTEEMMAVDYSKLVPMLVKEIQSLRQRVAQLESN